MEVVTPLLYSLKQRIDGSKETAEMTTPAPANALETVMLIQVDARVNHNKFYELSKLPDGNTLARWGRVGAGAQSRVYPGHHSFTAKRNEKLAKGYVEFGTSDRAGTAAPTNRPDLHKLVTAALLGVAGGSADLVSHLIGANRHAIDTATGGRIAVSDTGAVTTALGPVSLAQIARARRELATLRKGYDRPAVESYLTLIPQKIASVRATDWVTRSWCRDQDDLLDALESAVTMSATTTNTAADAQPIHFRHSMVEINKGEPGFAEIAARFEKSRNAMHDANRLTLHRVWELRDEQKPAWDARKAALKHSRVLWHGTTAGNVLSILRTGLICPPSTAGAYNTTGRMFGDGVYFSDQSTKSLNYAIGCAPGQRSRAGAGHPMMFLADVVMGRECRSETTLSGSALVSRSRTGKDDKGRGFDSLFVRGGHCGVRNNEMVVWNTEQIRLTHLCEFR
ncbi:uncharacterized protein RMCC_1857 [Mycolicibacterium canariasense]|jgi:poly [ADP-ribose] polymerase|uniref:NAD(+) ADP-ribosyltransferase n=2 Tax=Mycobacteriaceae TaxID=1762 RepID=A0A100WBB7_MYCCR|nr:uncharacterized protein RMCC_1857 [Mycolicibacterium canariasense]